MIQPTILAYNFHEPTETTVSLLCSELGLRCRFIKPRDYPLPIGMLVGAPFSGAMPGPLGGSFDNEMLVMCGLSQEQMQSFVSAVDRNGIYPFTLKGVLTPENASWSSIRMRDELVRTNSNFM